MPELVLHIGLPKTASSYIQKWLAINAKALRQRSVWVPSRQMQAHRIAVESIVNPSVAGRDDVVGIAATPLDGVLADLAAAASGEQFRSLVVSSEYFFEADPRHVHALLRQHVSVPIRIVILLRRQDRLVESGYNQSVKAMGLADPVMAPRYLKNLDWFELIHSWAAVFGGDRISVLNYDQLAQKGAILPGFLQTVDEELAAASGSEEFAPVSVVNESLPADLLEFKRIANSLGELGLEQFLYRLIQAGHPGPAFRISEDTARAIIALYETSNERVARDILRIEGPLFPEYGSTGERVGVDLFGQLPVETLAKVVAFGWKENFDTIAALKAEIADLKAAIKDLQP